MTKHPGVSSSSVVEHSNSASDRKVSSTPDSNTRISFFGVTGVPVSLTKTTTTTTTKHLSCCGITFTEYF